LLGIAFIMLAIAVLEKELIVVSGSAEEMMSCNQAFVNQNLFIFILSSDAFLLQIRHIL